MPQIFCCMCEELREAREEPSVETFEYRGEKIVLSMTRLICPVCGERQLPDNFGDPTKLIYDEYFRRHPDAKDVPGHRGRAEDYP